MRKSYLL